MAMNVGSSGGGDQDVMIEMNMTPLIDVMLVLIIMFIITIPIQNHSVNLNMPNNAPSKPTEPPVVINLDVDFDGTVSWNGATVDAATLETKLTEVANTANQPEVHLKPNALADYASVARVMAMAQRLGVTKIGMVGNEQFL